MIFQKECSHALLFQIYKKNKTNVMVKTWFQILLYEISFQINAVYIHWQTLDGKNLSFGPKKKKNHDNQQNRQNIL